jgi:hypothetical protein
MAGLVKHVVFLPERSVAGPRNHHAAQAGFGLFSKGRQESKAGSVRPDVAIFSFQQIRVQCWFGRSGDGQAWLF